MKRTRLLLLSGLLLISGCVTSPPRHLDNVCHIFDEKDGWYKDARRASKRWGTPIPVIMAFMHQESRFVANAKPPRTRIFWIFPGPRKSDAYGYSQAKDSTWEWYEDASGNNWSSRANFADAADFIAWYNAQSGTTAKIGSGDAFNLYLAYHEGHGGYKRGTYRNNGKLQAIARKVARRASRYGTQLTECEDRLNTSWWWPF